MSSGGREMLHDRVHASLLIFPELGALAEGLKNWIEQEMKE